jgi:hypothetical protein
MLQAAIDGRISERLRQALRLAHHVVYHLLHSAGIHWRQPLRPGVNLRKLRLCSVLVPSERFEHGDGLP